MARKAVKREEGGAKAPPFALAKAAADDTQVWCLDRHDWEGRHVKVGTLRDLEPEFPGDWCGGCPMEGSVEPGVKFFLFPLLTLGERVRYGRYARWGRTKIGWERQE